MKAFQRWLGIILLGAASLALVSACNSDQNSGGSSCTSDSDCRGDRICDAETGTCDWVPCESESDCIGNQDCVERSNGSSVCMLPSDDDSGNNDAGNNDAGNNDAGNNDTGNDIEDPGCLDDSDCAAGELCNYETEECAFECEFEEECTEEEICAQRENADGAICVWVGSANNDTGGCEVNEDCLAGEVCEAGFCEEPCEPGVCAEGFLCNEDNGICEEDTGSSADYRYIRVVDDSAGDACQYADPGSDLFGVEVSTDSGAYWARAVYTDDIVTEGNDFADVYGILDGDQPGLVGECPEANFEESVVSLGCSGSVIVEFVDGDGTPVFFTAGDDVTVYEYGAACGGSSADEWRAEVCTTNSEDDAYYGNCYGRTLGGGSGSVTVMVD